MTRLAVLLTLFPVLSLPTGAGEDSSEISLDPEEPTNGPETEPRRTLFVGVPVAP